MTSTSRVFVDRATLFLYELTGKIEIKIEVNLISKLRNLRKFPNATRETLFIKLELPNQTPYHKLQSPILTQFNLISVLEVPTLKRNTP